jgi:hypothetical protein
VGAAAGNSALDCAQSLMWPQALLEIRELFHVKSLRKGRDSRRLFKGSDTYTQNVTPIVELVNSVWQRCCNLLISWPLVARIGWLGFILARL